MAEPGLFWQALTTGLPGFLLGAGGLKVLELCFAHRKQDVDDAALIRQELRLEVEHFKQRVDKLDVSLGEWRDRYYTIQQDHAALKVDLITWQHMHESCQQQYEALQIKYERVHTEVRELRALVIKLGEQRAGQYDPSQ